MAHVFIQPLKNLGNGTASPTDIGSFYDWVRVSDTLGYKSFGDAKLLNHVLYN